MIRRGLGSDYNEGTGVDQDNTDGDNIKCNCKENIVEMEKVAFVINSSWNFIATLQELFLRK